MPPASAMAVTSRVCDGASKRAPEWRVLESGVLAVKMPLEVVSAGDGGRRPIYFDPLKRRLVCSHGWGQYHLSVWNGPRAISKPPWTTCDCRSAAGVCARKQLKAEAATVPVPGYYETLVATVGTTELRPGLVGARVPGVVGGECEPFFMVKGDAASVLRCRHGHTTHTLSAWARERQRHAAGLVVAALVGRRVARAPPTAPGGSEGSPTSRGARRGLVRLLLLLHAAREARRARRGAAAPCGCAAVYVKACVSKNR